MKKMKKITLLFSLWSVLTFYSQAQEEYKSEIRATWIASVWNIDWPKEEHLNNPDLQKADLIRMFDLYESINLNTVFLQVRPECDALYNSAYEPWSRWLTGTQGQDPGYDPLTFAIEEAHKRGLELHAWLNPYRISASTYDESSTHYDETHIYKEHPDWALVYDSNYKILNPGLPQVMSYIGAVVRDIITNYNVDGIHFDDYFYSYDPTPSSLDSTEYDLYGNDMSLGDWRRDNINRMIDTVYKVIQEENSSLRFGVSPFGIYKPNVPSGIIGLDAYNTLYCDPLAWLEDCSVDYLSPQLYWPIGGDQDFEELVNWWADQVNTYQRHLYAGHCTADLPDNPSSKSILDNGKIVQNNIPQGANFSTLEMNLFKSSKSEVNSTISEIGNQVDLVRMNYNKNGFGSVFYSANDFDRVNGLAEYLFENKYTHLTLQPEMIWKNSTQPVSPTLLESASTEDGDALTWQYTGNSSDRFAVYLSNDDLEAENIVADPNYLKKVVRENKVLLSDIDIASGSKIVVAAVTQTGKEGIPSTIYQLDLDLPEVQLLTPDDSRVVSTDSLLSWQSEISDAQFYLQIATNAYFSNVVYISGWISDSVISVGTLPLDGETTYYWRVKAKGSSEGSYSFYRSFYTGFPAIPELEYPGQLLQNVAQNPTIKWNASIETNQIEVLISEDSDYSNITAQETFAASTGQGVLSTALQKETWYNIKIRGINSFGESIFTETYVFETSAGEIPEVNLIAPENNAWAASFDKLLWTSSTTEGTLSYYLELALDADFSQIIYNTGWISETEFLISTLNLEGERDYYWHVKAKSEFGEGEFSVANMYFAAYPARPVITLPVHLSEDVAIWPVMAWNTSAQTDSIYVEFSEQSSFSTLEAFGKFGANSTELSFNKKLKELTWYYMHIQAQNEFGNSIYSSNKYFKTGLSNAIVQTDFENVVLNPNRMGANTVKLTAVLSQDAYFSVKIFNMLGQELDPIVEAHYAKAGSYDFFIYPEQIRAKGIYYIQVGINKQQISKKLMVY
jgi:uncharacterized lipoprotein YddW (UPF0748 family)